MPIGHALDLIAAMRESQLLDAARLDELTRGVRDDDPSRLAQQLVLAGLLTPYQADQLLGGRGRELVLGPYRLLELLGEGGMGQVFKAVHDRLGRVVALKVIRAERVGQDPEIVRRFQREGRAAALLSHPNVIAVHDADAADDRHFLAMEFVAGIDLSKLVRQVGPLPVAHACDYMRQAALGLQHIHEHNLIHRDIKPSNLLISQPAEAAPASPIAAAPSGDPDSESTVVRQRTPADVSLPPLGAVLKILDMGLARRLDHVSTRSVDGSMTQEGLLMGTPDYIAPEQARDSHRVDIRADLYSLGCTFYYILTGRPPFPDGGTVEKLLAHQLDEPRPLTKLRPDVPTAVTMIVAKLMAKRPEERYQTPVELAAALNLLSGYDSEQPVGGPGPLAVAANVATQCISVLPPVELPASAATPPVSPRRPAQKVAVLKAHRGWVTALAFAAGLNRLASGGVDGSIRVWDLTGSRPRETLLPQVHRGDIHALAFSPDGRLLASGPSTLDGLVWLWDVSGDTPRDLAILQAHQPVQSLAFSPDGRLLVGGSGPLVRLWELGDSDIRERAVLKGHVAAVSALTFSPDSLVLASSGHDGTVRLWNLRRKQRWGKDQAALVFRHGEQVQGLTFSADGQILASGGLDQKVRLWDLTGGPGSVLSEQQGAIRCVHFPPRGNGILVVDASGRVVLWNRGDGRKLSEWLLPRPPVSTVALTRDGRYVATATSDGDIHVFRLREKDDSRLARPVASTPA